MSHTYSSCLFHCVFSTKYRRKTIAPEFKERLWAFLGGIARVNDMKVFAVGGTEDHVHILLSVPAAIPLAKAVQLIKGGSSKWVHETFPANHDFAWQEGYGAFSVGISQVEDTVAYIQRQEEHHRTRSFEQEFFAILKKHGIEHDERFVWG